MGDELAESFSNGLAADDRLYLPDPVYQGGTVDRSRGSDWLVARIRAAGRQADHVAERPQMAAALLAEARPGDRILIMGARDDSLSEFAADLVQCLA